MTKHLAWVAAALALAAGPALAQCRPKPDDPKAAVPPIEHRSAFEGYQAFREEGVAPWRDVNDAVGRVGGHTGVLRADEAAVPAPAGAPPQPAAKAAPAQTQKR